MELVKAEELKLLDASEAQKIEDVFVPMVGMLRELESEHNDIIIKSKDGIDPGLCSEAKALRIRIAKVRTKADELRKKSKKKYMVKANAIQGVYNILLSAVKEKEESLAKIEKHYEEEEAKRIENLRKERGAKLLEYDVFTQETDIGSMPEEVWDAYLTGVKAKYDKQKEEEAEQERIRRENDRKHMVFNGRKIEVAKYYGLTSKYELTLETTAKEYKEMIKDFESKKKAQEEENERIRIENEENAKKLKEMEEENDKIRRLKEQEDAERAKREEAELAEKHRLQKELNEKIRIENERKEKEESDRLAQKLKEKEEKEHEEAIKMENERTQKNAKFMKFLEDNNYDDKTMKWEKEGDKIILWKIVNTITL